MYLAKRQKRITTFTVNGINNHPLCNRNTAVESWFITMRFYSTIEKVYHFWAKHLEKSELILLHLFFIQVVFWFYGKHILGLMLEIILLGLAPVCAALAIKADEKVRKQILSINLFFFILWLQGMLCKEVSSGKTKLGIYGIVCLAIGIYIFAVSFKKERKDYLIKLKTDKEIFILVLFFILFSLETVHEIPTCDSGVYYARSISRIAPRFNFTLKNIFDYCLASHLSVGYSLLLLMGELFAPYTAIGVHIVNIALASASIFCFYGILKEILPGGIDIDGCWEHQFMLFPFI